jgi:hypothetical protein
VSAYAPSAAVAGALAALDAIALGGAWIAQRLPARRASRAATWMMVVAGVGAALGLTDAEPAGVRMLAIIGALLLGMKGLVLYEWHAQTGLVLPGARFLAFTLAFTLAWPGMRPGAFAAEGPPPVRVGIAAGAGCLAAGAILLAIARSLVGSRPMAATWVALAALSLVLHFGLFRLLAAFWSARGIPVGPVFVAPEQSASLRDFWGRRWNTAFSDLTSLAVYRPLTRRFGPHAGVAGAFVFSGVLHELAISVPARGGYGTPLLYFLLHGALVALERALDARGLFPSGPWARLWTAAWLIVPVGLLFHAPFREAIVLPLLFM